MSPSKRVRSRDLAIACGVALLGLLASQTSPPDWLQAVVLGPLVLGACGYAIAAALFPPSAIPAEDRIVYSFVFSISAAALGGLGLQVALDLDRDVWLGLFVGLTLAAGAVAWLRRSKLPIRHTPRRRIRPPAGALWAIILVAAFGVAAGAIAVAADGVREQQGNQRFTSLWAVVVDAGGGAPGIEVGVWNHGGPTSYRLEAGAGATTVIRHMRLSPAERWRTLLDPAVTAEEGSHTITLYHGSTPYRSIELKLGEAP